MKTALASFSKALGLLALGLAAMSYAQAQEAGTSIAIVSIERLLTESKLAKTVDARIVEEFSKRDKAIKEQAARFREVSLQFNHDAPGMGERERTTRSRELIDMDKELQRAQREFREDLGQREKDERGALIQKALKIIGQIEKQEKYDMVLLDAIWYNPRLDITSKVLKELDK